MVILIASLALSQTPTASSAVSACAMTKPTRSVLLPMSPAVSPTCLTKVISCTPGIALASSTPVISRITGGIDFSNYFVALDGGEYKTLAATIGEKYGKSWSQVLLRYNYQRGLCSLPKSHNATRQAQNLDIFDFALTDDDMAAIAKLNSGVRYYTATPELIAAYATMELRPDL